jgi:hypothetical protein
MGQCFGKVLWIHEWRRLSKLQALCNAGVSHVRNPPLLVIPADAAIVPV